MASVTQHLFSAALAAYSAAPVVQKELQQPTTADAATMQSIVNRVLHAAKNDINAIPALLYAAVAPCSGQSKVAACVKGLACFMKGFLREENHWAVANQFHEAAGEAFDPQMRQLLQTVFDRQFNLEVTLLAGSIEPRVGVLMLMGGLAAGQLEIPIEIPTPVQNVVGRVRAAFNAFVSFQPAT